MEENASHRELVSAIVCWIDHESCFVRCSFYGLVLLISVCVSFFGVRFLRLSLTVMLPFTFLLLVNQLTGTAEEGAFPGLGLLEQLLTLHTMQFAEHPLASSLLVFAISAILAHVLIFFVNLLCFAFFVAVVVFLQKNRPLVGFFADHGFSYFLLSTVTVFVIFLIYIATKKKFRNALWALLLSCYGSFFAMLSFEKLTGVDLGMAKLISQKHASITSPFDCCTEGWAYNLHLFVSLAFQASCILRKKG